MKRLKNPGLVKYESTRDMISEAIKADIQQKLLEIERQENVCIFYACESGSRAWGFPSADSDYDVRFIYIRQRDWYLSIEDQRDVIERPLLRDIDLSGWEIRKALRLFRKSNPPLLEWLCSPIVYQQKISVADKFRDLTPHFYSPSNCFNHYLHMGEGIFRENLTGETIKSKRYFYVLRPLLVCRWIQRGLGTVPMEFETLVNKLISSEMLKQEIFHLIERKRGGQEMDAEKKIPIISDFIESEFADLKRQTTLPSSSPICDDQLNELFRAALVEVWK
jgi:predicted nucleotidyltransferase